MKTQYKVIKSGKGFRIQFTYENGMIGICGGEKTKKYFFRDSEIAQQFCNGLIDAERLGWEWENIEVPQSEMESLLGITK
jgi:hypothetical protein